MTRVVVFGASGGMGRAVCEAVFHSRDLELVGAVSPSRAGEPLRSAVPPLSGHDAGEIEIVASPADLASSAEVAVDFTNAAAARANLAWCAASGVHAVCGTTGLGEEGLARLAELFEPKEAPNCVFAANFAIGAVLMMRCAELCAPYFEGAEIVELHHDTKKDAPSGTSLVTTRRMAAARTAAFSSPEPEERMLEGTRGGLGEAGIRLHSVRLPGLVAHQEVLFGSPGETLTLRHDTTDRVSFMPGVVLSVRRVSSLPGLTIGLEAVLGL